MNYEDLLSNLLDTGDLKLTEEEMMVKDHLKNKVLQYAYGTEYSFSSPDEVFAQSNIEQTKALQKGMTNGPASIMKLLGAAAGQFGIAKAKDTDLNVDDAAGVLAPLLGSFFAYGTAAKKYGLGTSQIGEVEGGETFVTPEGGVGKFEGKDHEQGGEMRNLPAGMKIFSKRLKKDGETFADLVASQQRKIDKLKKRLIDSPKDKLVEQTLMREEKKMQELQRSLEQEQSKYIAEKNMYKYGTRVLSALDKNITKYVTGTDPEDQDGTTEKTDKLDTKVGDIFNIAGKILSGFTPLIENINSRANDTVNPNYYKDFGRKGLDTIDSSKDLLDESRDVQNQNIELGIQGARRRAANTSRSLNTKRAMDVALTSSEVNAKNKVEADFSKSLVDILGKQAQFEFIQDEQVMGGAKEADIANRQDQGAYESNRAAAKAGIFQMLQHLGKDMNESERQKMLYSLQQGLSKYGLRYDEKTQDIVPKESPAKKES